MKINLSRERFNLFIISFIALYFELLLIRWVAAEIRIFAYFKNFILIASFFGLGLGCANAKKDNNFNLKAAPWIFLIISSIVIFSEKLHLTELFFPDPAIYQWHGSIISPNLINTLEGYPLFHFLIGKIPDIFVIVLVAAICLGATYLIFYLVAAFFYFIGKELGRLIDIGDPLTAYSINVFGSLMGIIIFTAASLFSSPPAVWLLIGFLPFLFFRKRIIYAVIFLIIIAFLILFKTNHNVIWSPYYRISYEDLIARGKTGGPVKVGYLVKVDYDTTQTALDLSGGAADAKADFTHATARYYNLPYLIAPKLGNVLIIGSGVGNDVAAALRNNAKNIDAVEIDPEILRLGRKIHPEHPYFSKRVRIINDDGRAYIQRVSKDKKYDLIIFGFVDSLAALSKLSTVRLEFFMYTNENLRQTLGLLNENGLLVISFGTAWKDWIVKRLFNTCKSAFRQDPVCIDTGYCALSTMYLLGPAINKLGFVDKIKSLGENIITRQVSGSNVRAVTDDWPFLYNSPNTFPIAYVLSILIILCSGAVLVKKKIFSKNKTGNNFNWHMFFMGAAFLLFGSTWIVNSVVFASILLVILLANYINKLTDIKNYFLLYAFLGISLAINYIFPFSVLNHLSLMQKTILGGLITALPVFFAAIIFANAFKKAASAHIYLGSNILGSLFGGTMEATSLVIGIKNLLIIAGIFYILSYLCLLRNTGAEGEI